MKKLNIILSCCLTSFCSLLFLINTDNVKIVSADYNNLWVNDSFVSDEIDYISCHFRDNSNQSHFLVNISYDYQVSYNIDSLTSQDVCNFEFIVNVNYNVKNLGLSVDTQFGSFSSVWKCDFDYSENCFYVVPSLNFEFNLDYTFSNNIFSLVFNELDLQDFYLYCFTLENENSSFEFDKLSQIQTSSYDFSDYQINTRFTGDLINDSNLATYLAFASLFVEEEGLWISDIGFEYGEDFLLEGKQVFNSLSFITPSLIFGDNSFTEYYNFLLEYKDTIINNLNSQVIYYKNVADSVYGVRNTFNLISSSLTSLLPLLDLEIAPNITIGMLLTLPFVIGIISFALKVFS